MGRIDKRLGAERPSALEFTLRTNGLTELHPLVHYARQQDLIKQIRLGLARTERGETPTMADGGLFAIKTILPPSIPQEAWTQVRPKTKGIAAAIAGTNWKIFTGETTADNKLDLKLETSDVYPEENRKLTFADFINRMAEPIAQAHRKQHGAETTEPLTLGIALGFPHENVKEDGSPDTDARFITEEDKQIHGKLTKEWQITDWDTLSDEQKLIGKALRKRLEDLGINVSRLVIGNDTSMVALDAGAQLAAERENPNSVFFPNGAVFGSGTNMTFNGINTEIGRAYWDYLDANRIYKKMFENGWTKIAKSELEHETGQFLRFRLAAGIQILGEQGFYSETQVTTYLETILGNGAREDQAFMTKVAKGIYEGADQTLQKLAQGILRRAGQIYGIMAASITEVVLGTRSKDSLPAVILAEGGVIHDGCISDTETIKNIAETTAMELGQPIKIVEASGASGALTAAMSMPYLSQEPQAKHLVSSLPGVRP